MCGIVGIINAMSTPSGASKLRNVIRLVNAREFITESIIASGIRGLDSTGIFQVDHKNAPYLHKLPVSGHMFIEDKATKPFLIDCDVSPITVCHVRAATTGRVTINNAHPFSVFSSNGEKHIMGVHNGTLQGWEAIAGKARADFSVDSEWALQHIAEEGADAFEDFKGSFSFVWWDKDTPTQLHFARNDQRPMCFARTLDKQHVLFASEAGMLYWLASRNNIALEENIYMSEPGKMYSIDADKEELLWNDRGFFPVYKAPVSTWVSSSSKKNYHDYTAYGKESLVARVKKILADARANKLDEVVTTSLVPTTNDMLEDGLPFDDDDMFLFTAKPSWYSDSMATMAEKNMAKSISVLGNIVEFEGAIFDDQTFEIVGDALDVDDHGKDMVFTSILRGEKKETFETIYADKINYCVVIGAKMDPSNRYHEFVLAPLNEEGAAGYQRLLSA